MGNQRSRDNFQKESPHGICYEYFPVTNVDVLLFKEVRLITVWRLVYPIPHTLT